MGKRTRRSELSMLGVLFIAGGFFASVAVAQPAINVGTGTGSPSGTATFSVTLSVDGAREACVGSHCQVTTTTSCSTSADCPSVVAATQNDIAFDPKTPIGARTSAGGNCTVTVSHACTNDAECPILPSPFDHEACVGSPGHCAVTTTTSCSTSAGCPQVHEPCVNQTGPVCTVNSAIGKSGFFTFLPHVCVGGSSAGNTCAADTDCTAGTCTGACTYGTNCTGVRAIILAVDNLSGIPDGSTLYTCTVDISSSATTGTDYTLTNSNKSAGDTSQALISGATGDNGKITVGGTSVLVCDAVGTNDTGTDFGQFGDGKIKNNDVVAIFKASLGVNPPPAGSALFSAMDAVLPADVPPTCGGDTKLKNNDVVACFTRSLLGGPKFTRTYTGGTSGTCVSAQQ
jgi:hypothetical protein